MKPLHATFRDFPHLINSSNLNLMKKLAIFSLCILLFNCESGSIDDLGTLSESILKSVNYPLVDAPENCPGRTANFDDLGRIIEVYYECNGNRSIGRNYDYSETGLIQGFSGYLVFTYDENDVLIGRSGGSDTGTSYHDFTYNNNMMTDQGYYNGTKNQFYTTYEFEDNSYKKLISSIVINSNTDEIISRITYQYNANNPIEIFIEKKSFEDPILEPKKQILISYDDKINPYRFGLAKNAYLASQTFLAYDLQHNIAFTADNNIKAITFNNLENNSISTHTNTYTYNDDGYPTEALLSVNGAPFRKELFEYYE